MVQESGLLNAYDIGPYSYFYQENLQVNFGLYFRQTATSCSVYAISEQNGTPKQLRICPSKISMAPMSVDWENMVLETIQSPVD